MNDEENKQNREKNLADNKNAADKPASANQANKSSAGTSVAGGLALVLSLAAIIGSGYIGYILFYKNPGLLQGDINATTELLIEDTRKLQEQLAEQDNGLSELAENQAVIKDAIEQSLSKLGRDRHGWAITETEQLLIIANHRLQLARDIPSAIAALETADKQLRALANPKLLQVRKAIADEIAKLRELEPVDRAGIVLRLETLMGKTDDLQLSARAREQAYRKQRLEQQSDVAQAEVKQAETKQTEASKPADEKDAAAEQKAPAAPQKDNGVLTELWNDIKGFVSIRTDVDKELPLLSPEQNWYLKQNMRLMLSGARHALLANDKASYEHSLETTIKWINTYFDVNASNTAAILEELNRLKATDIAIEMPDISASLKALRSTRENNSQ